MNEYAEKAWRKFNLTNPHRKDDRYHTFMAGWSAGIREAISICKEEFVGLPGSRMPHMPVPRDLRTIDRLRKETLPD